MSIGRSGSLPLPKNVDSAPSAAATGIINLRVEPLSLQSISAFDDELEIPFTVTISPLSSTDAPSAVTAEIVASLHKCGKSVNCGFNDLCLSNFIAYNVIERVRLAFFVF